MTWKWKSIILLLSVIIEVSLAESYDCTLEKHDGRETCVFRNVKYFKNTTHIAFYAPDGTKPENVAFVDSDMFAIPPNFLTTFGNNLKVLRIENCNLRSVTITRNMEALHAKDNSIEKVIMYRNSQCDNLQELDLSRNRLQSVANVTNCGKLVTLNLHGNENLWGTSSTLDLSIFERLEQLESLNLSGTGVLYMDNSRKTSLKSLREIDLSKNDILPVDFNLEIFYPFTALDTLRLNDNNMISIDYAYLRGIKSLKTVYLNGNSFPCLKIPDMLAFLKDNNIETPKERHSNCQQNAREVEEMCCTGQMPPRPRPPFSTGAPASGGSNGSGLPLAEGENGGTEKPPSKPDIPVKEGGNESGQVDKNWNSNYIVGIGDDKNGNMDNGGGSHTIGIVVGVVVAAALLCVGGVIFYKRKQRHHY